MALSNFVHLFRHAEAAQGLYNVRTVHHGSKALDADDVPTGSLAFIAANADTTPSTRHTALLSSESDVQAPADLHRRPVNRARPAGTTLWGPERSSEAAAVVVGAGARTATQTSREVDPALGSLVLDSLLALAPSAAAQSHAQAAHSAAVLLATSRKGITGKPGERVVAPPSALYTPREMVIATQRGANENAVAVAAAAAAAAAETTTAEVGPDGADSVAREPAGSPHPDGALMSSLRRRRAVQTLASESLGPGQRLGSPTGHRADARGLDSRGASAPLRAGATSRGGVDSAGGTLGSAGLGGARVSPTPASTPSAPGASARRPRASIAVRNSLKDHQTLARSSLRAGDVSAEARAHFARGVLFDEQGRYELAVESYRLYLGACHRAGDLVGEALAYNHLGVAYQAIGGRECLEAALACHLKHAEVADQPGQFIAEHNAGGTLTALGLDREAVEHFGRALDLASALADTKGEALAAGQLGAALGRLNDRDLAGDFIRRRVAIANGSGSPIERAVAFRQLAELEAALEDHASARGHFEQAVELVRAVDPTSAARALTDLACYASDVGDYAAARAYNEDALALAIALDDPALERRARCGIGLAVGNLAMRAHFAQVARAMGVYVPDEQLESDNGESARLVL